MNFITHLDKVVRRKRDPIRETEDRIQERLRKVEPGTPEFKALLENQQQCKEIRRTGKEGGFFSSISLKDILTIGLYGGGALLVTFLGYALDMESPRALKIADRGRQMFPNKKM